MLCFPTISNILRYYLGPANNKNFNFNFDLAR
jgi:hypothetical protein